MINDNTILSSFNDRPTLLEWLKKVEEALKSDTATAFHVNNKGNATLTFSIDFADGTSLESGPIVLQKGESVKSAEIRSGHLILTLTNGDELDAGDVKPVNSFLINESQHLIVNFEDGTSQDLGAIFSGNVNIDGTLSANLIDGTKVTGNEIVEKMSGYSYIKVTNNGYTLDYIYAGIVKNGNKLTCVVAANITKIDEEQAVSNPSLGYFGLPSEIMDKLYPTKIGNDNLLATIKGNAYYSPTQSIEVPVTISKSATSTPVSLRGFKGLSTLNTTYYVRVEVTFLLSNNLSSN